MTGDEHSNVKSKCGECNENSCQNKQYMLFDYGFDLKKKR
jgi:hypothetical protein